MTKQIEMKILNLDLNMFDEGGVPKYGTEGSAAFDLRAMFKQETNKKQMVNENGELVLEPNESVLVPTGIAINIGDPELAAIVLPRSSVGAKRGLLARLWEFDASLYTQDIDGEETFIGDLGNLDLDVGNIAGLIDSDYQGEIFVSVWNRSNKIQTIEFGERIAQLMFTPIIKPSMIDEKWSTPFTVTEAEITDEFSSKTDRGTGGLGSTGKK